jgi:hypothetical protein
LIKFWEFKTHKQWEIINQTIWNGDEHTGEFREFHLVMASEFHWLRVWETPKSTMVSDFMLTEDDLVVEDTQQNLKWARY